MWHCINILSIYFYYNNTIYYILHHYMMVRQAIYFCTIFEEAANCKIFIFCKGIQFPIKSGFNSKCVKIFLTLWNYFVLGLLLHSTVFHTICYADDTLMVITGDGWENTAAKAKVAVTVVVRCITDMDLTVAVGRPRLSFSTKVDPSAVCHRSISVWVKPPP